MRRHSSQVLAALLLAAVLLQHAEARAMKGPGLKGLHKGPLARFRHHKPRVADHMRAAGRMAYVAPQDYPGAAPAQEIPEVEYYVEPYSKGTAADAGTTTTNGAAASSDEGKPYSAAIKVAAGGVSDSKPASKSKAKAAAPKATKVAAASEEHKTDLKHSAQRRAAPAADAVPTGPSVEDQLQAFRDAPVQFLAPKPTEQPAEKLSTPEPVLQDSPAQQAAPESVAKSTEAVSTRGDASNQVPLPAKVPVGQMVSADSGLRPAAQQHASHGGAAVKPAALEQQKAHSETHKSTNSAGTKATEPHSSINNNSAGSATSQPSTKPLGVVETQAVNGALLAGTAPASPKQAGNSTPAASPAALVAQGTVPLATGPAVPAAQKTNSINSTASKHEAKTAAGVKFDPSRDPPLVQQAMDVVVQAVINSTAPTSKADAPKAAPVAAAVAVNSSLPTQAIAAANKTAAGAEGAKPANPAPADKPAAATDKPAAAVDKPAAVTDKPAAAVDKPAAADKPIAATDKPVAAADKAAGATNQPAAASDKAAGAADKPVGASDKLTAATDKPAAAAEKPVRAADKPAAAAADKPSGDKATQAAPVEASTNPDQQHLVPDDVSIFSIQKIKTADGKVEVVVKPLQGYPAADGGLRPQIASVGTFAGPAGANATGSACTKPELSSHETDIAFTAGQNGLSITTLSASCAAARSTLGGGCSLKCDFEDDLSKITLVKSKNMSDAADAKEAHGQPAVCSYQISASLKGNCKAVLKVACCMDAHSTALSVSTNSMSISSASSSTNSTANAASNGSAATAPPLVNVTITNKDKPSGQSLDPALQPLSIAQMLEQAAAAFDLRRQASQSLAMQHMQQLQAELLASQARLAAAGARMHEQTHAQLNTDMQRLALLSSTGGWNPLGASVLGPQNPALGLWSALTPQFPAAAAAQAAAGMGGQAVLQGQAGWNTAGLWNSAADAATQWKDGMAKLLSSSASSWWPFGSAAPAAAP